MWEYNRFYSGIGLNPVTNDCHAGFRRRWIDECAGIQRHGWLPRLKQDAAAAAGVASSNVYSGDMLNPLDVDTDGDGLLDSFEAAWYDTKYAIDPTNSTAPDSVTHITVVVPGGANSPSWRPWQGPIRTWMD